MQNCPLGWYCPDPETMLPCPAGFFCPHKSSAPIIICSKCEVGATQMERDRFGYIILITVASLSALYILYKIINRYDKDFLDRLHLLDVGILKNNVAEFEHRIEDFKLGVGRNNKRRQRELKKVRHKVELINRRLALLVEQGDLQVSPKQA